MHSFYGHSRDQRMLGNACILELEDLAGAKFLLPNFLQMANSTFGRCSVGFMVVLPTMSSYFINANVRTNCAHVPLVL